MLRSDSRMVLANSQLLVRPFLVLLLLAVLVGCNRTAPTPKTAPSSAPKSGSSAPAPGHETLGPASLNAEAKLALRLINAARASGRTCKDDQHDEGYFPAAKPIGWNLKLEAAARGHSSDMRERNYFAHASPSGLTLQKRLERVGYVWRLIGENIAAGQPTIERAVEGWVGSASHCAVLMNADFTQMGIGRVEGSSANTYKVYWTLDFGRPR
jgi:uncharacterized protein YkwD